MNAVDCLRNVASLVATGFTAKKSDKYLGIIENLSSIRFSDSCSENIL